jgi:hypothetical protein
MPLCKKSSIKNFLSYTEDILPWSEKNSNSIRFLRKSLFYTNENLIISYRPHAKQQIICMKNINEITKKVRI